MCFRARWSCLWVLSSPGLASCFPNTHGSLIIHWSHLFGDIVSTTPSTTLPLSCPASPLQTIERRGLLLPVPSLPSSQDPWNKTAPLNSNQQGQRHLVCFLAASERGNLPRASGCMGPLKSKCYLSSKLAGLSS